MKYLINKKINIMVVLLLLFFVSCETIDTDLTQDPSAQLLEDADIDFQFNSTQIFLANFFESAQFPLSQVTRMELMRSTTYENQFVATRFNGVWINAYQNFLNNNRLVLNLVQNIEDNGGIAYQHRATAQIMEAYVITTLVDIFGDVPYSETLQGSDNFNPKRDSGEEIYDEARILLENSIVLIDTNGQNDGKQIENDFYYDGNMSKWKKLANSLLLKLAVQARLNDANSTTRINDLLLTNDFINSNNDDFQFNYSSVAANPDSRHSLFVAQYVGGAGIYMSAPFLRRMSDDPRFRYYFYHQDGLIFGREHGDAGPGVSSEFPQISVHGLYPVGGKYYNGIFPDPNNNPDSFLPTSPFNGTRGAGLSVIFTNSFTKFMIAEAQLMLNNDVGAARSALENGITESINKVTSFGSSTVNGTQPSSVEIADYISNALVNYDNASGNEAKLNVIITEYYKSLWGNGIEVYNNYRRTGYPNNLQASVSSSGSFTHSIKYPSIYIENNNNPDAVQHSISEKVWWAEGTTFNLDF